MLTYSQAKKSPLIRRKILKRRIKRQFNLLTRISKNLFKITEPFHKALIPFLLVLVFYEGLQAASNYFPSWIIHLIQQGNATTGNLALFFTVLIISDLVHIYVDNWLDYQIVAVHLYPIYRYLKVLATKKLLDKEMPWHQMNNSGALIGKVNNGIEKVHDLLSMVYWEFVPTIIQTIVTLIPLLFLSPLTVLIMTISLVFFMALSIHAYFATVKTRKERHDLYESEWAMGIEAVQAVETVKMFTQKDRIMNDFDSVLGKIQDKGTYEARLYIYRYNRLRLLLSRLTRSIVWAYWISSLLSGNLSIPSFVFLNTLNERLFHTFWRFARLFDSAQEASESVDRLVKVVELSPSFNLTGKDYEKVSPTIELNDLHFTYETKRSKSNGGLHGVSLKIDEGEIIGLVGPSGSGKTTLRRLITGLWQSTEGSIKIGGKDVKDWNPDALLKMFSYVPQGDDVHIFDGTIKKNIAFSKPDADLEEIKNAAKLAGIDSFISSLSGEYETEVGEKGVKLSGGQKQRIALARAILANRPILILDEATSAVDAITEDEIQNNLITILKGKTAIIIAHRLSTLWDIANRIVVMEDGYIKEVGNHEELIQQNGLYAQMVTLQTKQPKDQPWVFYTY